MNWRVVQGAGVLVITLVTVGALATSPDRAAGDARSTAPVTDTVTSTTGRPAASVATPDVPVRSGLATDDQTPVPAAPVRVTMAGIGLDADVLPVGVDADHQFDVPEADTVGWYRFSSEPGGAGASVLAAHVDYGGRPGAFFDLDRILPGDLLEVELDDGRVLGFRVTGNTVYDKSELPAEELFRKDGEPVLQLITCGGSFDPVARSYQANVVVTAVPWSA